MPQTDCIPMFETNSGDDWSWDQPDEDSWEDFWHDFGAGQGPGASGPGYGEPEVDPTCSCRIVSTQVSLEPIACMSGQYVHKEIITIECTGSGDCSGPDGSWRQCPTTYNVEQIVGGPPCVLDDPRCEPGTPMTLPGASEATDPDAHNVVIKGVSAGGERFEWLCKPVGKLVRYEETNGRLFAHYSRTYKSDDGRRLRIRGTTIVGKAYTSGKRGTK